MYFLQEQWHKWAVTCDFQQCGILISVDSDQPVQPPVKLRNSKLHRIFIRPAKALIRLRVCAGWSEALLVAHTTLLEILCRGSNIFLLAHLSFNKSYPIAQQMFCTNKTGLKKMWRHICIKRIHLIKTLKRVFDYKTFYVPYQGPELQRFLKVKEDLS